MPELNPLSNEQIFLKKIAENTGSDYNTGDVSEINPLTIDQILLKEIAANTASQTGDITELKGKVADNTGAIEAMVNVNGCCNVLQNTQSTQTEGNVVFTSNSDGSVTADSSGQGADLDRNYFVNMSLTLPARTYKLSGGIDNNKYIELLNTDYSSAGIINTGNITEFTVSSAHTYMVVIRVKAGTVVNDTFYPMLYDARLNPTGYVQYAMTNEQLTERMTWKYLTSIGDNDAHALGVNFNELYAVGAYGGMTALLLAGETTARSGYYNSSSDNGDILIHYSNGALTVSNYIINGNNQIINGVRIYYR